MAVPNTNTFCLSTVRTELQISTSCTYSANTTLNETFTLAANVSFDNTYEGSQDRLSNYRSYSLITGWTGTGGAGRGRIAFDGANMWTADFNNNSVTKITSGGTMTTYTGVGAYPYGIAYNTVTGDMWTANYVGSSVSKITPAGSITTYSIGGGACPRGIAFDGTNMWSANYKVGGVIGSVSKINNTGGTTTYSLGSGACYAMDIAFDGTNMWVTHQGGAGAGGVVKVTPTGGTTNYTFGTAYYPNDIVYDGTNMFISTDTGRLIRVSPTGTRTYFCGIPRDYSSNMGIAYAGTSTLWLATFDGSSGKCVTKVCITGLNQALAGAGIDREFCISSSNFGPMGIAYGCDYVWVTSYSSSCVIRIGAK